MKTREIKKLKFFEFASPHNSRTERTRRINQSVYTHKDFRNSGKKQAFQNQNHITGMGIVLSPGK